ncbi:MBL fold metallo-hydrolase [Kitasatospora paranensis]|uniref:MBL fold metallo-hydrolase n=1 Tax=Kitasatospora paranensis TaxID=258053 RepID=A0ABW2FMF5_9ACTN
MSRLDFTVVDLPESSQCKTAVLVTGAHGVMLVDTGLSRSDGRRLAERVRATGLPLTTVVVSHSDPDFYFGTEEVHNAFPDARFLAHPVVIGQIAQTYPAELAAWASRLGSELPTRPPRLQPMAGEAVEFEGHRFEVRGFELGLPDRHYLWEHRARVVLGGVLLFQGVHPRTADTPTAVQREAWIDLLDGMTALDPALVLPGHRAASTPAAPGASSAIAFTQDYLKAFERELGRTGDAAAAEAALLRLYPDAALPSAAEAGTRAALGTVGRPTGGAAGEAAGRTAQG